MKKPKFTIIIPTCYGGAQLLTTAKSVYDSAGTLPICFLLTADSRPLKTKIKANLTKLGVRVTENNVASSQYHKVNQMIDKVRSDYLITTQDDVVFDKDFFSELLKVIDLNPQATLILPRIASAPSKTLLQKIFERGVSIAYKISLKWNDGDNYLAANGRCMVFKKSFLENHRIPENVVNGDGYRYFANKFGGGKCVLAPLAVVYNNNPSQIREQINQTQRFKYSRNELESLFKRDLSQEYKIPKQYFIHALWTEFNLHPIQTFLYAAINLYIRAIPIDPKIVSRTSWEVAKSTKD